MITIEQLKAIVPKISNANAAVVMRELPAVIKKAELNTPARLAAFLAQTAVESASFGRMEENLNYSAERLFETFNKYFKNYADALAYARNPVRIANKVYANRMGNGSEASGDGWKHRGMGWIMITGANNQRAVCNDLGIDLKENHLLATMPYAALSAAWFWRVNKLNRFADAGDFKGLTVAINGGLNGWTDRVEAWNRAKNVLNVA